MGVTNVRETEGEAGSADGFVTAEISNIFQSSECWLAVECTLGELDAYAGRYEGKHSEMGEVVLA